MGTPIDIILQLVADKALMQDLSTIATILRSLEPAGTKAAQGVKKFDSAQKQATSSTNKLTDAEKKLRKAQEALGASIKRDIKNKRNATIENKKFTKTVELQNTALHKAVVALDRQGRSFKDIRAGAYESSEAMQAFTASLVREGPITALRKLRAAGISGRKVFSEYAREMTMFIAASRFGAVMIMTSALYGLVRAAKAGAEAFIELDSAVRKVMSAQVIDPENLRMSYGDLADEIKRVAIEFNVGFKDAGTILFELKSAGLSVNETMAGFDVAAKLVKTDINDIETATRLLAGVYQNFGITFEEAGDTMIYVLNQSLVSVDGLTNGLKHASSIAAVTGADFDLVTAAIGTLNDKMLSGGIAGRGFRQLMVQIAQETKYLREGLGIVFDESLQEGPQLVSIFAQLAEKFGEGKLTMEQMAPLTSKFGTRAAAALAALIEGLEKFQKVHTDLKNDVEKGILDKVVAERMKEATNQFGRMGKAAQSIGVALTKAPVTQLANLAKHSADLVMWMNKGSVETRKWREEAEGFSGIIADAEDAFLDLNTAVAAALLQIPHAIPKAVGALILLTKTTGFAEEQFDGLIEKGRLLKLSLAGWAAWAGGPVTAAVGIGVILADAAKAGKEYGTNLGHITLLLREQAKSFGDEMSVAEAAMIAMSLPAESTAVWLKIWEERTKATKENLESINAETKAADSIDWEKKYDYLPKLIASYDYRLAAEGETLALMEERKGKIEEELKGLGLVGDEEVRITGAIIAQHKALGNSEEVEKKILELRKELRQVNKSITSETEKQTKALQKQEEIIAKAVEKIRGKLQKEALKRFKDFQKAENKVFKETLDKYEKRIYAANEMYQTLFEYADAYYAYLLDKGEISEEEYYDRLEAINRRRLEAINVIVKKNDKDRAKAAQKEWEDNNKIIVELNKELARDLQNTWSDLFFDFMEGELDSLSDYFKAFGTSVKRSLSDALGTGMSNWMMGGMKGNPFTQMGQFFGFGGGGTGAVYQNPQAYAIAQQYGSTGTLAGAGGSAGMGASMAAAGPYVAAAYVAYEVATNKRLHADWKAVSEEIDEFSGNYFVRRALKNMVWAAPGPSAWLGRSILKGKNARAKRQGRHSGILNDFFDYYDQYTRVAGVGDILSGERSVSESLKSGMFEDLEGRRDSGDIGWTEYRKELARIQGMDFGYGGYADDKVEEVLASFRAGGESAYDAFTADFPSRYFKTYGSIYSQIGDQDEALYETFQNILDFVEKFPEYKDSLIDMNKNLDESVEWIWEQETDRTQEVIDNYNEEIAKLQEKHSAEMQYYNDLIGMIDQLGVSLLSVQRSRYNPDELLAAYYGDIQRFTGDLNTALAISSNLTENLLNPVYESSESSGLFGGIQSTIEDMFSRSSAEAEAMAAYDVDAGSSREEILANAAAVEQAWMSWYNQAATNINTLLSTENAIIAATEQMRAGIDANIIAVTLSRFSSKELADHYSETIEDLDDQLDKTIENLKLQAIGDLELDFIKSTGQDAIVLGQQMVNAWGSYYQSATQDIDQQTQDAEAALGDTLSNFESMISGFTGLREDISQFGRTPEQIEEDYAAAVDAAMSSLGGLSGDKQVDAAQNLYDTLTDYFSWSKENLRGDEFYAVKDSIEALFPSIDEILNTGLSSAEIQGQAIIDGLKSSIGTLQEDTIAGLEGVAAQLGTVSDLSQEEKDRLNVIFDKVQADTIAGMTDLQSILQAESLLAQDRAFYVLEEINGRSAETVAILGRIEDRVLSLGGEEFTPAAESIEALNTAIGELAEEITELRGELTTSSSKVEVGIKQDGLSEAILEMNDNGVYTGTTE